MICPPTHKHALTLTCAKSHKCRCGPCRAHHAERRKAWNRRTDRVSAELARAHIARAIEHGASTAAIGERVGLPQTTVWHVYQGTWPRVTRDVHEKIMSFKGAPRNTMDAYRVERRLKALATLGYSMAAIASECGVSATALRKIVAGSRDRVNRDVAVGVLAFYRTHHMTPAIGDASGIARTVNWARRGGFHPPAAWDDIDDPDEQPAGARWRASGDLDAARPVALPHESVCPRCGATFSATRGGRVCRDCRDVMEVAA